MPKKIMLTLYYASAADARTDCEIIGIDKKHVQTCRHDYSKESGHFGNQLVEEKLVHVPITHILRFGVEKMTKINVNKLHHVDNETTW